MKRVGLALDGQEIELDCTRLALGLFTSRSEVDRQAHVKELRQHGIKVPTHGPAVLEVDPHLLTTDAEMLVSGNLTTGEAEFVLFLTEDDLLVGLGSDHTDRVLEAVDVRRSKEACGKVLARSVWRYSELRDHWDALTLSSWVGEADLLVPYQHGSVGTLMKPEVLLQVWGMPHGRTDGVSVLFSGTIPTLGGELVGHLPFCANLEDPILGRRLALMYTVKECMNR